MVNGYDGSRAGDLPPATQELIRRRDRALGGAYRLFYDQPVTFTHGSGVHLFDAEGNAYLDAYNNVPSVGPSPPHVPDAVSRQLATLNTHTRYLTEGVIGYAERLLATHDLGSPANAMFTCTGSQAGGPPPPHPRAPPRRRPPAVGRRELPLRGRLGHRGPGTPRHPPRRVPRRLAVLL